MLTTCRRAATDKAGLAAVITAMITAADRAPRRSTHDKASHIVREKPGSSWGPARIMTLDIDEASILVFPKLGANESARV